MAEDFEDQVEVMDLYLASYYLVRGCELVAVKCIPTEKSVSCSIVVQGSFALVGEIQGEYFEKRACVNLWAFRSAYNQVNSSVHQAKKSWERTNRASGATTRGSEA